MKSTKVLFAGLLVLIANSGTQARSLEGNLESRRVVSGNQERIGISAFVPAEPVIVRFQPLWGAPGTRVTIEGENFRPGDHVLLDTAPLPLVSLDAERLVVEISQEAKTGFFHIVRGSENVADSPKMFEVIEEVIDFKSFMYPSTP